MKTVLKEFLELLRAETLAYYEVINNESNYASDDVLASKTAVTDLESLIEKGNKLLLKEREQIETAYLDGSIDGERGSDSYPNGYYEGNFIND